MQRIATYKAVKPSMEARYRQEHDHIWPEVLEGITRFGFHNDCICVVGQMLFTYYQAQDTLRAHVILACDPAYQAWHARLADCVEEHPIALDEVFYVA